MPRLTVSPAIDGTWVRLERPDGKVDYFDKPLDLWHAIVGQPGRHAADAKALGLIPDMALDPHVVRPEWLRVRALVARQQANAPSLRRYGIGVSGLPEQPEKPAARTKLRVPKWARDKREELDLDPSTACL